MAYTKRPRKEKRHLQADRGRGAPEHNGGSPAGRQDRGGTRSGGELDAINERILQLEAKVTGQLQHAEDRLGELGRRLDALASDPLVLPVAGASGRSLRRRSAGGWGVRLATTLAIATLLTVWLLKRS